MNIQNCRSCGADIVFLKTASGKAMPVNADTISAGDVQFDAKKHKSHFASCPNSAQHRKPRTSTTSQQTLL